MLVLPLLTLIAGAVSGLRMMKMSENRFVPPALEERLR